MQMSEYAIKTTKLTKRFGEQIGVDCVNMNVPSGKIYGLLGRNGAGKTTIMRMLLNLASPTSGEISLLGEDYPKKTKEIYHRIGSMIETPGFYENLTGKENLEIFARLRGQHKKNSVQNALEIVGLEKETKKTYDHYSLGMKQRLGIAAAIMHEPEMLILDEPINGLDPVGIQEVRKYLEILCSEKGVTILISSHNLSEIEQIADIIGVMHEGRLIEEVAMQELLERNRQYLEFVVSDENKACLLLEQKFQLTDYSVHENRSIRIYTNFEMRSTFNLCFVENGISVFKIIISEERLEDYFSNLIGGGGLG
jgi:bacitracin transport system ATP-binding protein